jgi:hypothetical protein
VLMKESDASKNLPRLVSNLILSARSW